MSVSASFPLRDPHYKPSWFSEWLLIFPEGLNSSGLTGRPDGETWRGDLTGGPDWGDLTGGQMVFSVSNMTISTPLLVWAWADSSAVFWAMLTWLSTWETQLIQIATKATKPKKVHKNRGLRIHYYVFISTRTMHTNTFISEKRRDELCQIWANSSFPSAVLHNNQQTLKTLHNLYHTNNYKTWFKYRAIK